MSANDHRQRVFSIAITSVGRVLLVRDRLLGRVAWKVRGKSAHAGVSRHSIASGKNQLDAVFVAPEGSPPRASVLICHGIGETVDHWIPVQQILAASGVASLVFDYSGYGRSSGHFTSAQSERNTISAFHFLERLTTPLPVSILGFSMGSGIANSILSKVPAHRLVLCAAFTSFRSAAARVGVPKAFAFAVPPIWDAADALRENTAPVLIVHGERDRLFPVKMARKLNALCGSTSKLVIVPGLAHNEPFRYPKISYWGHIVSRFLLEGAAEL
jgi:pimeloyl-ACP methyl ester carboxylesterase